MATGIPVVAAFYADNLLPVGQTLRQRHPSAQLLKTEEVRRLFVFLGVRLIGVSDGIDTAIKGNRALSGFKGLMNDIFLDESPGKDSSWPGPVKP